MPLNRYRVMAIGNIFMAKIQRQEALSTNTPPTRGPRMKEIPVQAVQVPIALPCGDPEKAEIIMASELGTSKAPAIPCRARAIIKKLLLGAIAHNSEAVPKPKSPRVKIRLRPSKSDNEPAIRISEPSVSR